MATSTLGSGTLVLAGTTSGTTTVTATAVAGTTTLTLPAATDTLVGKATTDTLTNKTLTAPTLASANITTALTIAGAAGTVGQALTSGGTGAAPTWSTVSATPGGSTTQVQYNNAGAFAGSANFTYASGTLSVLATTSSAFSGAADAGYSLFRGTTNSSGGVLSVSGNSTGNGINYVVFNSTLTGYEPANYGASEHIWKLGGTEALRLNSSANLVLQGGTTTANGIGITFPATQSASSNANTLDDYEEGTWTPSFSNLTVVNGTGGATFSGTYTKIGRVVYITAIITVTGSCTTAATASTFINNLPFTAAGLSTLGAMFYSTSSSIGIVSVNGGSATNASMIPWTATNSTVVISGFYNFG